MVNILKDEEERRAWDAVIAAVLPKFDCERPEAAVTLAIAVADEFLKQRRAKINGEPK